MKAFRGYLITCTLLLGILSCYIPIRYHTSYPMELGPQFDSFIRTTYIDVLNREQPEVLLLGDSMSGAAVDDKSLASRLGKKTMLVSLPGTASTIWYVMIKNNIVLAKHKPRYLIIFFRDTMMTLPGYRVSGRYFEQIDEFAAPADKLLIQRAYINQMTPPEKVMERYVPLYGSRVRIRQSIEYYIRYSLARVLLHCNSACVDYTLESVFGENNLELTFVSEAIAASDEYLYTTERLDFKEQVGKSFLPEMIRLCQENDIQLILVRMPILRFEEQGTQPAGLNAYIQNLAAYLAENKVPFLDFDQKIFTREYFMDNVHLNAQGKVVFTERLAGALRAIVR